MPVKTDPCSLALSDITAGIHALASTGHAAWQEGLMTGFSGNMSLRINDDRILLTAAGTRKGQLETEDFVVVSAEGELLAGGGRPSSESGLHTALYAAFENCAAIIHAHPPRMQALELVLTQRHKCLANEFMSLDLFEAGLWRSRLAYAESVPPGSPELAQTAVAALRPIVAAGMPCAVWLPRHGLCALGETPAQALGITEELEHLAGVQLLV